MPQHRAGATPSLWPPGLCGLRRPGQVLLLAVGNEEAGVLRLRGGLDLYFLTTIRLGDMSRICNYFAAH